MDRYDKAIEYLKENPKQIYKAWANPSFHQAGCLFGYASPSRKSEDCPVTGGFVGCLTQIRVGTDNFRIVYGSPDLTDLIRADTRIPDNEYEIELKDLHVFAEWQRKLDKELNRS